MTVWFYCRSYAACCLIEVAVLLVAGICTSLLKLLQSWFLLACLPQFSRQMTQPVLWTCLCR